MTSPGEDFDWADDDVREFDIPQSDTKRLSNIEEEPEPKETQPKNISPKKENHRSRKNNHKPKKLEKVWLPPDELIKELKSRKSIPEAEKSQLKNVLSRAARWNMFARTRKLLWPDEDEELKKVAEKIFVTEGELGKCQEISDTLISYLKLISIDINGRNNDVNKI
ncbi:Oidioi.mRNA.OKI2018_I69.PAR.g11408.t1.cds [Oikopleura dioica]|uniref:Oidioi.mRNA.OKI2018_I69.PAR.g11408.t1.cds n=1 Tax=Oikopleura dioica TaxID=34765 RepID=A0ABN7RZL6_OIKDI|nr:Oidioi.mRNA.OKI2018_I69.PAR.g11408.t1.cds [Oikopleura dioica]